MGAEPNDDGRVDKVEARRIALDRIDQLRRMSYQNCATASWTSQCVEIRGYSGVVYQVETEAWWDDPEDRNLRVTVAVDDAGWSAWCPLTEDFIIAPDGSFVGE